MLAQPALLALASAGALTLAIACGPSTPRAGGPDRVDVVAAVTPAAAIPPAQPAVAPAHDGEVATVPAAPSTDEVLELLRRLAPPESRDGDDERPRGRGAPGDAHPGRVERDQFWL